ncbi:MAG: amino acid ABC transporter permease [Azospirillum sp.]|nr:amino acid ABC transporter permease [Azospirillum sp.]MCA3267713.1 amino acid ABC transporter permease [Azospirillum sp.]
MADSSARTGGRGAPAMRISLNDPVFRAIFWQVVVVGTIGFVVWYLIANTLHNLEVRKIATGWTFLDREAGFAIGESLIEYEPDHSYGRALWVGALNTLRVAAIGIVLATILGTFIGIGRLSKNWLISKVCSVYVEFMRNLPLLVQLFFWWAMFQDVFPGPRQALEPITGVFFSNRGIKIPVPAEHWVHAWMGLAFLAGIAASMVVGRWAAARQAATGEQFPVLYATLGLVLGLPFVVWLIGGAPVAMDWPVLRGFNFQGGLTMTPEFAALLVGLVTYTAGFIAEIVRAGILAVPHGQTEAASALGIRRGKMLQLVILPQALRVIVPPMTSQYLNLTKNSSLAVAIGYPDLVSIANTTINQTGQAIEGIAIIMAAYLTVSLSISLFMNWYNKRIAFKER